MTWREEFEAMAKSDREATPREWWHDAPTLRLFAEALVIRVRAYEAREYLRAHAGDDVWAADKAGTEKAEAIADRLWTEAKERAKR